MYTAKFQELAIKGAVTQKTILEGWQTYEQIKAIQEQLKGRIRRADLSLAELMNRIEGHVGSSPEHALLEFRNDTYATYATGEGNRHRGPLLEGIDLPIYIKNAEKFCHSMEDIGRLPDGLKDLPA